MFSSKCSVVLKYNECVLCLCRVYILDLVTKGVKMFGHTGSGPGCFKDPAGLAVDSVGNMLVADSKNHRLCLHDSNGRFLTEVKLDPSPKRPSGLLLDQENGDIYLLNLQVFGSKGILLFLTYILMLSGGGCGDSLLTPN